MSSNDPFKLTWFAMGTEWELTLHAPCPDLRLRSVAEAIVAEVERVEQLLSFYRDDSDLSELNALAALRPVRVDPRLFHLMSQARELSAATGGTFDPTIGPLLRAWGFVGATGAMPAPDAVERARSVVGMSHVSLDPDTLTVRFDVEGVELEFGAIGKGYAIDRCVELLTEEFGIRSALIHGGGSTIYGIGAPPGAEAWNIAIQKPGSPAGETLTTVPLRDRAVSVSAPHGKSFEHDGQRLGHVLDPRTGQPTSGAALAAVATESATESDALSTALLVLGEPGIQTIQSHRPDAYALTAGP